MQDAKTKPARQLQHWMLGAATGGCMSWCTYIQDKGSYRYAKYFSAGMCCRVWPCDGPN